VRVDRVAFAVVDRPGLQVVFGQAERLLGLEQPVVGVDDELSGRVEVGDVPLQAIQGSCLGLQLPVDGLGRASQLDEPVALDRCLARDGLLCRGDLLVDAAQGPAGTLGPVLVEDRLVAAFVGRACWPRLGEDVPIRDVLIGMVVAPLLDDVRLR
jgi:hypothetical protein